MCLNFRNSTALLLTFFVSIYFSFSQEKEEWKPSYMTISVNEGLPSSETYFVHQDKKGFIWICTDRGVVRYDGYRYQVFNKEKGLLDNVVFKVVEDHKGRIWFISFNHQLCYFENGKIHPYQFNKEILQYKGANYTPYSWFSIDKQENVFFSVRGNHILKISKTGKTSLLKNPAVISFVKVNNRWMGAFSGKLLDQKKIAVYADGKQRQINLALNRKEIAMTRQEIQQFGETIYVTSRSGIYDSNGDSAIVDYVVGLNKIGNDLWVGTLKGGYLFENIRENGLSKKPKRFFGQCTITSVCKDKEGGYWFSTLQNGVIYSPNLSVLNAAFSENPSDNDILDVYRNKNLLLVTNVKGGYDFRSKKELSVNDSRFIFNSPIPYIKDQPFIGMLEHLRAKNKIPGISFFNPAFSAWCKESDTSILLIGPYVVRTNISGREQVLHHPIDDRKKFKFVKSLLRCGMLTPDKEFYISDLSGLYRLEKNVFQPVHFPEIPEGFRISAMKYSDHWGMMIATAGHGLFIVRNGKVVRSIHQNNGLLSDHINSLYVDQNNYLYVATNKGVSRVFFDGKKGYRIQNLTNFQGLNSPEVNASFEYKGTTYFATKTGLSKVGPAYEWANSSLGNQIHILDVFANGKPIEFKKGTITLNHQFKVIKIRLCSTNFRTKGKAPYKYRLSENAPWNIGYNGEILLLNPAYEKFTIEIKYQNENGIWSKPYFLASLEVLPPFYQTIWFYVLISILIVILTVYFLVRRVKVIHQKNEIQRNMEMLEQKALLAQMNPHFIFNSLNSIQSFLLYDENELAERYLLKLSKLIRMTLTNSRETEITIQRELDSLRMYLELEQMRFKNRFDFEFNTKLTPADLQKFIPPMLIQPFVENAIIHGFKGLKQGGQIELTVYELFGNTLFVQIIDNGHGYDRAKNSNSVESHKSYGTQITSERLSLFKDRYQSEFNFTIKNRTDETGNSLGTEVNISIPVFDRN